MVKQTSSFKLITEVFRLLTILVLYIIGLILLFTAHSHTSFPLFFLSTFSFYALSMMSLNYLLSFGSESFRNKVKHNGYTYFLFWSIFYLFSIVFTPILIIFMIIRTMIEASNRSSEGSMEEPLIEDLD